VNVLTLKWAEFLTAWTLAVPEEREDFQKKHGPVVEPPELKPVATRSSSQDGPVSHDAHGAIYFKDLDPNALRDGKLVRKK